MNIPRNEWLGAQLTRTAISATLGICILNMMVASIAPLLLNVLFADRGLTPRQVGVLAAVQTGGMVLSSGMTGAWLRRRHLRPIMVIAAIVLALSNLVTAIFPGLLILMVARAIAGAATGLFMWLFGGLLAKATNPSRWGGVLTVGSGIGSLMTSLLMNSFVYPSFGAKGVFSLLVVFSAVSLALIPFIPRDYLGAGNAEQSVGLPPMRGVGALTAVGLFMASLATLNAYLGPLAAKAGLSSTVVGTAVSFGIAGQILAGLLIVFFASRISYLAFSAFATLCYAVGAAFLFAGASAVTFITVAAVLKFSAIGVVQSQLSFVGDVDPSRRSLMFAALAEMFGGVFGPLTAAALVGSFDVRVVLLILVFYTLTSLGLTILLGFNKPRRSANLKYGERLT